MKNKETRKKEAAERELEYNKLSPAQKMLKLDLKLGGGVGAVKQRRRLGFQLSGPAKEEVTEKPKKNYQKPKRS